MYFMREAYGVAGHRSLVRTAHWVARHEDASADLVTDFTAMKATVADLRFRLESDRLY